MSESARLRMPEIVEYAIRQAGIDPDDVADWRVSTDLVGHKSDIDVMLKPEMCEETTCDEGCPLTEIRASLPSQPVVD